MAVKIIKKGKAKVTQKKASKTKTSVLHKLVNKLGDKYLEMVPHQAALKPLTKEWKPLFSAVQTAVDEKNKPEDAPSVTTGKYVAAFTAHGIVTSVTDASKAFKLLEGVEKGLAWKLMGFSITELRKYLTPDQFESLTEQKRTKARSVTITYLDED